MTRPKQTAPKPPKGLRTDAVTFWRDIQREYGIEDHGGLRILEQASRAYARALEAEAILRKDGIVIRDRWEQPRPHPAVAAERDARAQVTAALRALDLDVDPPQKVGRPGGR